MSRVKDEHAGHNHKLDNLSPEVLDFYGKLEKKFPGSVKVTSGARPTKIGKSKTSHHSIDPEKKTASAIDIVGPDMKAIHTFLTTTEEGLGMLAQGGLGVIDETTPEMMKKTGATGAHLHIGPDSQPAKLAKESYDKLLANKMSQTATPTNPVEQTQETFDLEAFRRDAQKEKEKEELLKKKELESLAMQDIEAKKQMKADFLKDAIRERENSFKTVTESSEEEYIEPQRDYSFLQQRNPANSSSPLFSTGQELS